MNLFIPIILIIISTVGFFTYIDVEWQEIKELKKIQKKFTDQKLKTEKIIKKKRELNAEYSKIDSESQNGLLKLLPNHVDNVELIVDIRRIIKENGIGIQISDISLTKANSAKKTKKGQIEFEDEKKYNSIDVSFSFTTKYNIFKRFMSNIKESLRVLDVVSINFKPQVKKNGKSSDNFKFDIKLRTYWLKK